MKKEVRLMRAECPLHPSSFILTSFILSIKALTNPSPGEFGRLRRDAPPQTCDRIRGDRAQACQTDLGADLPSTGGFRHERSCNRVAIAELVRVIQSTFPFKMRSTTASGKDSASAL